MLESLAASGLLSKYEEEVELSSDGFKCLQDDFALDHIDIDRFACIISAEDRGRAKRGLSAKKRVRLCYGIQGWVGSAKRWVDG